MLSICRSTFTSASHGLSSGGRNATCSAQTNTADVALGRTRTSITPLPFLTVPARYTSLGGNIIDPESNGLVIEVRVDGAVDLLE
jgi:hypothetical protein